MDDITTYRNGEPERHPGGSLHFFKNLFGGKNVAVECGSFLETLEDGETKRSRTPAIEEVIGGEKVHVIFLTHAHLDHSGMLPLLARLHPEAEIIMTAHTYTILREIVYPDCLRIMREEAEDDHRNGREPQEPLYTEYDVRKLLERAGKNLIIGDGIHQKTGKRWNRLPGFPSGCWYALDSAGHTPDAMRIWIATPKANYCITGDTASHNQPYAPGAMEPGEFIGDFLEDAQTTEKDGLRLITEATNGARELPDQKSQVAIIQQAAHEAKERGGIAFYGGFALDACSRFGMRLDLPIYLMGSAYKYADLHASFTGRSWTPAHNECLARLGAALGKQILNGSEALSFEERKLVGYRSVRDVWKMLAEGGSNGNPIGAASATLLHGPAAFLAPLIISRPENVYVSTAHRFEGTPGAEIFNIQKGHTLAIGTGTEKIHVPVACDVVHADLSAHSGGPELARFAYDVVNARIVVGHHADDVNLEGLEKRLLALPSPPQFYRGRLGNVIELA